MSPQQRDKKMNSLALIKSLDKKEEVPLTIFIGENNNAFDENLKYVPKSLINFPAQVVTSCVLHADYNAYCSLFDFAYCLFIENGRPQDSLFLERYGLSNGNITISKDEHVATININKSLDKPLCLIYLNSEITKTEKICATIEFNLQNSVHLNLIEYIPALKSSFFAHIKTSVVCKEASSLNRFFINNSSEENKYNFQNESFFSKSACENYFHLNLGMGRINAQINKFLKEDSSKVFFHAVDLLKENAQAHTVLNIEHESESTISKQMVRGVYQENSFGNFLGKVVIHQEAQKSEARQHYKSILVDKTAKAFARPQLEIYNSDIAASHGATVGELDDEALFYLQSRGIDLSTSKNILISSLLKEIIKHIEDEKIKKFCEQLLAQKLNNNSSILDIAKIRNDFECLNQNVYGEKPLAYLDNAATMQKPSIVIDTMNEFYKKYCANINRGAYSLAALSTKKYADAREKVAQFIKAKADEIVFTKSATESINLVANSLAQFYFKEGDEIVLTQMEHHANIVPWYIIAKQLGLKISVVPVTDDFVLDMDAFRELVNKPSVKFASFIQVSHALGTINPVKEMVQIAKNAGVPTLIDGSQAISHLSVDVKDLGCDFYAFSGHKVCGPFGIGVLFAQNQWLEKMPPYQTGGDMIASVAFDNVTFAQGTQKFEAGTPNITAALGLASAVEYISSIGLDAIHKQEKKLFDYAMEKISTLPFVKVFSPKNNNVAILSFAIKGVHPHDIASILDREGVCIRAGHLCAEPLVTRFGESAFCRASFSFYNTFAEVDQFIKALCNVAKVFKL